MSAVSADADSSHIYLYFDVVGHLRGRDYFLSLPEAQRRAAVRIGT